MLRTVTCSITVFFFEGCSYCMGMACPELHYWGHGVKFPPPRPLHYWGHGVKCPPPRPLHYWGHGVKCSPLPGPFITGGMGLNAPLPGPFEGTQTLNLKILHLIRPSNFSSPSYIHLSLNVIIIDIQTSVVLVRSLHFSYGLVTVCNVHLYNSYIFG